MNITCGQVDPKLFYIVMCKGIIIKCFAILSVGYYGGPDRQRLHDALATWKALVSAEVDRYPVKISLLNTS